MTINETVARERHKAKTARTVLGDLKNIEGYMADCNQLANWLEELQQYRAIGTVEECRTAMEKWIPVSERLPDVDEYILVSFENFTTPMIGRYTVDDDDSGTFRVGDEDESFVEDGLFVNAWMPLPEPYRMEENNER